jgi:hypothetical protein
VSGLDDALEESIQYSGVRSALIRLKWIGGHTYCVTKAISSVLACADNEVTGPPLVNCVDYTFVGLEECEAEFEAMGG